MNRFYEGQIVTTPDGVGFVAHIFPYGGRIAIRDFSGTALRNYEKHEVIPR